ncbi:oligopeptide/dipeptide ABC transporter ATP-binding protein [Actinomadura mexicana]|uniref:Peptide/nickel transport system ATP-binding protein n=1 Tax=Actinomadura mexicana TaxID=134959 RepID=A0A239A258_9ACTN|nr:ABC transporter ATP-binding protein [Actinomadura mexicana]SNR89178.1 peptide/nickel transport system ATP-binding protein [Actinomadura mexicana]
MTHTDEPGDIVLDAEGVSAGYGVRSRNVLHDVSVAIARGRTMGVVGESGSGKSTLARVLVGQIAPARGVVRLDGTDVHRLSRRERFAARRQIQLVPQDPYSSLDPRMSVGRALAEAVAPRGRLRTGAHRDRIAGLLESVALDASAARRLPHEFSGGQRQRIVIARALAAEPRVIIADEVTSSLDTSVQAEILELLLDLQRRLGLTYVFITHDLAVAQYMCTDLSVLYLGTLVEQGTTDVLSRPGHPYTELLRDSRPDPSGRSLPTPAGGLASEDVADPANPPSGCVFHPRCRYGPRAHGGRDRCAAEPPILRDLTPHARRAACHYPIGPAAENPDEDGRGE